MYRALSRSQINKISIILILIAICISLLLFKGTVDPFIPMHISIIEETVYNGGLVENQNFQVPGFYILGAQIILICGLAPAQLMFYPIQLIPYALILFLILFKISGNPIFSALLTAIDLCSGTTGTGKIFFWPHGIGEILFFSILLLVFLLLKQDRRPKPFIFLVAVIISLSLVYISYDATANILILLAVIVAVLILFYKVLSKDNATIRGFDLSSRTFSSLFLILFVAAFGLSNFVYFVFIPTLQNTYVLSGLDKFLISYFNPNLSENPLSQIIISYPTAISVISGIKYALLDISSLIFGIIILKTFFKERSLPRTCLFIFAILIMTLIYASMRLLIGGELPIFLYLPGILCIALFSRMSKKYRALAVATLLVMLVCTPLYYGVMENGGYIDRDDYQFNSYKAPVQWFIEYNNGDLAVSDELTKDLFTLYSLEHSIGDRKPSPLLNNITEQHKILPTEDATALVQLSEGPLDSKYYILNQRLNRMSLNNWIIIESWEHSEEQINTNNQINKIYDVPFLSIYYPPLN